LSLVSAPLNLFGTTSDSYLFLISFLLSAGKKSLLEGFSKLYAFVKALEMDHSLAMCGVAI
jgi:hypothetical protein